jgi:hypothetical protein
MASKALICQLFPEATSPEEALQISLRVKRCFADSKTSKRHAMWEPQQNAKKTSSRRPNDALVGTGSTQDPPFGKGVSVGPAWSDRQIQKRRRDDVGTKKKNSESPSSEDLGDDSKKNRAFVPSLS